MKDTIPENIFTDLNGLRSSIHFKAWLSERLGDDLRESNPLRAERINALAEEDGGFDGSTFGEALIDFRVFLIDAYDLGLVGCSVWFLVTSEISAQMDFYHLLGKFDEIIGKDPFEISTREEIQSNCEKWAREREENPSCKTLHGAVSCKALQAGPVSAL